MKEFKDKVAVITGAASGIGRGLANRCMQEGMKVVLADIDEKALTQVEEEMKAAGASVLAVLTDVSKVSDIEALAHKTLDTFGAVHLLFNNAGVAVSTSIWESAIADWKWVIDVNLWGVIHGIRVFVPIMLKQDTECHIINTSSVEGLICSSYHGIYQLTKHAVVALSEALHYELAERAPKVKVSVLCPAWVRTRIANSERNRPEELPNDPAAVKLTPQTVGKLGEIKQEIRQHIQHGMHQERVADCVFNAITKDKFYILTQPEMKAVVQMRMVDILLERNPTDMMTFKYKLFLLPLKYLIAIPRLAFVLMRSARTSVTRKMSC
jgi:NADP-dependent 3-hydroxy acid dehydrogenase YdfG